MQLSFHIQHSAVFSRCSDQMLVLFAPFLAMLVAVSSGAESLRHSVRVSAPVVMDPSSGVACYGNLSHGVNLLVCFSTSGFDIKELNNVDMLHCLMLTIDIHPEKIRYARA